ncbi:MAG: hypothetical protein M8349_04025 [ANME-2 cluster archaeon]|nr:hypothetical protein [ANME-2 cluster archaeon]
MEIIKSSLSDIIAGLTLIVVSVFVYFEMFNVLRNPLISGFLGLLFLSIAYFRTDLKEYWSNKKQLLNLDLNGFVAGISLLVVSILGSVGHFYIVRHFLFPLVPGIALILVAFFRTYVKTNDPDIDIKRTDPCSIVGGQLLVLYSILLYMGFTSLAWNPIFPLFVAAAIYTTLFLDVLPKLSSNKKGVSNSLLWMNEIEDKISDLKHEFEEIKLDHDDPHLMKSLERLNTIQNALVQLKEISDSIVSDDTTQKPEPDIIAVTKPQISDNKTDWEAPNSDTTLGVEIESNELEDLIGPKNTDSIFYENIQKEFNNNGLANIIKEAKEIRKSLYIQRESMDDS